MPQRSSKQPTAAQRADEALDRVAPAGKSPARRTLDFLLAGSHEPTPEVVPSNPQPREVTPPDPAHMVAPERNFNKRANSLEKLALPAGLFPGSSKALYDALYVRTRGAVVPARSIRATKRQLSEWSGIRNIKTIDSHLRYFSALGLVVSEWERGQNEGALYEVLLPEETSGLFVRARGVTPPNPTSPQVAPPDVGSPQNLGLPHHQNLGLPHPTQTIENTGTSENRKTFFKTNTENDDDDAALAGLKSALKEAARELTGRQLSVSEQERWRELGELLVAELKIAAARTPTVSSVPAFLTEHLRRRLWKKDKQQLATEGQASAGKDVPGLSSQQLSKCPDCGGSGFYYPHGFEAGVAKCRHERLQCSEDEQPSSS